MFVLDAMKVGFEWYVCVYACVCAHVSVCVCVLGEGACA